jgi:hypothetical protein
MPQAGMYIVARQPQAGQESFRVYALPSTPPSAPFAVRTATTCTGDVRNLATQALGDLQRHFASGAPATSFTVTPHTGTKGTWYELDPGDPTVIPAMMLCGRIAATTLDAVTKLGLGGKAVPELNYAPSLGLYLLRPQFGTRPSPSASPAP